MIGAIDHDTWHKCLDAVRDAAMEQCDAGGLPDVGKILSALRSRYLRDDQAELDQNPARVQARRIEARRG